jgi:carboxyl-terminal processing protease
LDLVDLPLSDVVKLIRGPKGTRVRLTLIPGGASDPSSRKTIALVRDEIKLEDQEAKARIVDWPQTNGTSLRLGLIDLPSFYGGYDARKGATPSSATADVAKLIRKLEAEHVQGLILDLRQNGGGSLEEAITLTGLFIHKGPVVQTREPNDHVNIDSDTDSSELYDGPMIVLTSRFTASASEILAGALQDYGRALIVGDESTFGKGTVQTVVPLARFMDEHRLTHSFDPGALKVTIQTFYRPSGASTQLKGVAADIALPSLSNVSGVGEVKLEDPLPWDRVPPADFIREDHVSRFLKELRARSAARVAGDKDFACLREEIAQFKKNLAIQTVSLNEADRRRENEAAGKHAESLKKGFLALGESEPATYDITVENADTPGLPAPQANRESSPTATLSVASDDKAKKAGAAAPSSDLDLRESEYIMADYVNMLTQPPALVAAGQ